MVITIMITSGILWVKRGGRHLAQEEFERAVKLDVEARVREGVKTILEEILQEEMTEHIGAGHRETTSERKGERNGHYRRDLVTGAGKIERLEVPRDREGEFVTEVFERYKRLTGSVEEAILEMYLSGVSTRKIAGITEALSRMRIGKDTVSRITSRLREQQKAWRERRLEKDYPYLYLDATYLKVNWGAGVTSLALLSAVGVNAEGYREVLAVEVAGAGELPGVDWQRCVAHTIRTQSGMGRYHRTRRASRRAIQGNDVAYLQGLLAHYDTLDQKLQDGLLLLEGSLA